MPANGSTALTGYGGTFTVDETQIARITQWEANEKIAHMSEWGDSDSKGYTCRAAGRVDCTFTAAGKFDTEGAGGDTFGMNLFAPDDAAQVSLGTSSDVLAYTFPRAICNDFKISCNVDSEEVIGWNSDWGADGEFTGYAIGDQ